MLRSSLALVALLAACAAPDAVDALPTDVVGTPGGMGLTVSPIVPGAPVTFTITNALRCEFYVTAALTFKSAKLGATST